MSNKELEEAIIRNYQADEQMMILVFAQWCVNHDLDPAELYYRAYPEQSNNMALIQGSELTVPRDEAGEIPDETLLNVLSLYDNEALAFVVMEEINKRKK